MKHLEDPDDYSTECGSSIRRCKTAAKQRGGRPVVRLNRVDTIETKLTQIKSFNKCTYDPNRIVLRE